MGVVSALRCWPAGTPSKPPEVALTAVMRKLAVLANALLKQERLWTTEPVRRAGSGGNAIEIAAVPAHADRQPTLATPNGMRHSWNPPLDDMVHFRWKQSFCSS